jgi:hypothetical protein
MSQEDRLLAQRKSRVHRRLTVCPTARSLRIEPLEERRLLATVTTLDDGIGVPGTSLREAIADATPGETIDFAVTGTINLTSLGDLTIDKNLTISGPGANLLTIRAYDPTPDVFDGSRVFNIDDGNSTADKTVSISGLTLTGGDVLADGGAIRSFENLTLAGSTISGNSADGFGGGVYSAYGDLTVIGSTVIGNSARYSGGGIHGYYGSLAVTGSTISGNSTTEGDGGGIYSFHCPVSLTSSTIRGNFATYARGGGIFSDSSTVSVTSSTISGNAADNGGGLYSYEGNLTVTSSTISGNQAATDGGGIYKYYGDLTVTHSTITGNQSDADNDTYGTGGGVYLYGTGTEALRHTILAGNTRATDDTRDDAIGDITLRFSLIGDGTGANILNQGGNQIGTDTVPINPLLGPLAHNGGPTMTHALLPGSLAIDRGNMAAVPGGDVPFVDQRGSPFTRVVDGDNVPGARIDIGAFERQPIPPAALGDYNKDDVVNAADHVVWRKMFDSGTAAYSPADGDGDGTIDQDDYDVWRVHFGETLPPSGGAPVPGEEAQAIAAFSTFAPIESQPGNVELASKEASDQRVSMLAPNFADIPILNRTLKVERTPTAARHAATSTARWDAALLAWLSQRADRERADDSSCIIDARESAFESFDDALTEVEAGGDLSLADAPGPF